MSGISTVQCVLMSAYAGLPVSLACAVDGDHIRGL